MVQPKMVQPKMVQPKMVHRGCVRVQPDSGWYRYSTLANRWPVQSKNPQ